MKRIVWSFLFLAGNCFAHPGHGAPEIHAHEWDLAALAAGIGVITVIALAMRRRKKSSADTK
jgi:hypothetical protein